MTWGLEHHAAWWQLWSCHLAHWDLQHLLLNAAAAIPPVILVPRRTRVALLVWALVAAPLVSLAILPAVAGEYRGASGLVVGLWLFSGVTLLRAARVRPALALLGGIGFKLVFEALHGMPSAGSFETLSLVHYAGAVAGAAGGFAVPLFKIEEVAVGDETCS